MQKSKGDYTARIGKAGELRVASELLLRGHRVCLNLIDSGTDLILENNIKIQVKCARKISRPYQDKNKKYYESTPVYHFSLRRWGKEPRHGNTPCAPISAEIDFVICWAIDDDIFYVIPADKIRDKSGIVITFSKNGLTPKFSEYIDCWNLLFKRSE